MAGNAEGLSQALYTLPEEQPQEAVSSPPDMPLSVRGRLNSCGERSRKLIISETPTLPSKAGQPINDRGQPWPDTPKPLLGV